MHLPKDTNSHLANPQRRSFLKWLGTGTVLSLAQAIACSSPPTLRGRVHTNHHSDVLDVDSDQDANSLPDATVSDYPFQPGSTDTSIFQSWPERTVDPQDLASILQSWRLFVDGMVQSPRVFRFDELVALPSVNFTMDFHCVEGWSILDVPWNGLHLSTLWNLVRPRPEATYVTFHTIGGTYNESLPLAITNEPHTLLAYGIQGYTLPIKHGFPLRLVVPRLLAYKSAKYVERIELTDHPVFGFWVQRGYPYDALVPEGRLREGKY